MSADAFNPDHWGLRPLAAGDVDAVHAVFSDPATWEHLPSGVYTRREQSLALVDRAERDWRETGLGEWAVLLEDAVVGIGGVTPRDGWWNLGFRLGPAVWGRGMGTWVADVALAAAHRTRREWPVVARSLVTNPASAKVSENIGLTQVHADTSPLGIDRVIHADRPLDEHLLRTIVSLD